MEVYTVQQTDVHQKGYPRNRRFTPAAQQMYNVQLDFQRAVQYIYNCKLALNIYKHMLVYANKGGNINAK